MSGEKHESSRQRSERRVRTLYGFGSARWYDPFRRIWTWATSQSAEDEIDRWLRSEVVREARVLDIGCGTGFNLGRLKRLEVPFKSYVGADFSESMLEIARSEYVGDERVSFVNADVENLKSFHDRFDLVLCTWVASHLDAPREVFELGYELLAPSGTAVFLTMSRPRWFVRWWFAPLAWMFQARVVDPANFEDLPGCEETRQWTAGLVTLVRLERPGDGRDQRVDEAS